MKQLVNFFPYKIHFLYKFKNGFAGRFFLFNQEKFTA